MLAVVPATPAPVTFAPTLTLLARLPEVADREKSPAAQVPPAGLGVTVPIAAVLNVVYCTGYGFGLFTVNLTGTAVVLPGHRAPSTAEVALTTASVELAA